MSAACRAFTIRLHYAFIAIIMLAVAKSITIRNVPEQACRALAARAAGEGRSLQEYLRSKLIEFSRMPDVASLMAEVRRQKSRTHSTFAAADILAARDADRR